MGKDAIIVAAAMRYKGVIASLPRPARHNNIIHEIGSRIPPIEWPVSGETGFLTSDGEFVGRQDAMLIAKRAGQIAEEHEDPNLYSEDLW